MFFSSKTRGPPKAWSHTVHVWVCKVCVSLMQSPRHNLFGSLAIPSLPLYGTQTIFVHSRYHHHWVFLLLPDVISLHSCRQSLTLLPDWCHFITHALWMSTREPFPSLLLADHSLGQRGGERGRGVKRERENDWPRKPREHLWLLNQMWWKAAWENGIPYFHLCVLENVYETWSRRMSIQNLVE